MVKRRQVLAGAGALVLGVGVFAFDRFGGGNGRSMDTDGDGQGCRSGIIHRAKHGTFEFMNVVRFETVTVQLSVVDGVGVDELVVSSGDEILHTEQDVKPGKQELSFVPGEATRFDITAKENGSVIDSARFYSTCSARSNDTNTATI